MSLSADDARMIRRVKNEEDCDELEGDLDRAYTSLDYKRLADTIKFEYG